MNAADANADNPFPAEAIMTFGPLPPRYIELKYMTDAYAPVRQYLIDYTRTTSGTDSQDRAALGFSGEHGSGKTFLLSWMRDEISKVASLPSKVAYAKADTADFGSIYRLLMRNFTLPLLQEVVATAVRRIIVQRTGAAFATAKRSEEIKAEGETSRPTDKGGALEAAYDEKIVDRNEIYLDLKQKIAAVGVPQVAERIAQVIGFLDEPTLGQAAFDWLCGDSPAKQGLPVSGPLLPQGDASDVAVDALECIAALFAAAEMPLVVMVDQIETFAASGVSVAFWTSMTKKLAEQVRRQNGYVILAGTRVAWDKVPRDVGPRLIGRDPIVIGGLERDVTELLLNSYCPKEARFRPAAMEAIHRLSGGNAREILQIAHRCWRATDGKLDSVDGALVLRAARETGTLDERRKLALADIDRVLERMALSGQEFRLPDSTPVDRLVAGSSTMPAIAIVLAKASDPIQEVETAQSMTRIREALESVSGKPALLVVPIGYSSSSVLQLIATISRVVAFDGPDFEARLQVALNQLTVVPAPSAPAPGGDATPTVDVLLQRFEALQTSLGDLRNSRQVQAAATSENLAEGARQLAAPEREEREARTKWELVDGLETIQAALDHGPPEEERAVLRSLLVANEVNIRNSAFDYLGGLYLDALDVERDVIRVSPLVVEFNEVQAITVEIRNQRARILGLARRSLMERKEPLPILPLAYAAGGALIGPFMLLVLNYWFVVHNSDASGSKYYLNLLNTGLSAVVGAAVVAVVVGAALAGALGTILFLRQRSPPARFAWIADNITELRRRVSRLPSRVPAPTAPAVTTGGAGG